MRRGRGIGTVLAVGIITTRRACSVESATLTKVGLRAVPQGTRCPTLAPGEVGWVTGSAPNVPTTTMPRDRLVDAAGPRKRKRVWKISSPNSYLVALIKEWELMAQGSILAIGIARHVIISTMRLAPYAGCVTDPSREA